MFQYYDENGNLILQKTNLIFRDDPFLTYTITNPDVHNGYNNILIYLTKREIFKVFMFKDIKELDNFQSKLQKVTNLSSPINQCLRFFSKIKNRGKPISVLKNPDLKFKLIAKYRL